MIEKSSSTLTVTWTDSGMEPQCAPDPDFPKGKDLDVSSGAKLTCSTDLPYPAKRIGIYTVECSSCGLKAVITTAGRLDDPRHVKVPCRLAVEI